MTKKNKKKKKKKRYKTPGGLGWGNPTSYGATASGTGFSGGAMGEQEENLEELKSLIHHLVELSNPITLRKFKLGIESTKNINSLANLARNIDSFEFNSEATKDTLKFDVYNKAKILTKNQFCPREPKEKIEDVVERCWKMITNYHKQESLL